MKNNFLEYYTIQKDNNKSYNNPRMNSNKKKDEGQVDLTNIQKKGRKISENNSNINSNVRYLTPLQSRYQTQSYDINNVKNNNSSYSGVATDTTSNMNQYQYQEKSQKEKDNDALYYKNLYHQTKNNLNKEKQKNEENQKNAIIISNLTKENNMLKEKINNLTSQLDRLINLVEKSNDQNAQKLNMKQEEINKLNYQINSLMKNNNLIQLKNREEKESLTNAINKLNTNNQNTKMTLKNYQNKLEQINQESNTEINNLKEQIISLNKNLTLCINEKNKNDQKNKEIINELNKQLTEKMDVEQKLEMDTTNGFYNVFDFSTSLSLSTKIYGFYTPLKKLFPKGRVEKFRHVITPHLSISYHPDFAKKGWGYYDQYDEPVYSGYDSIAGRKIQKVDADGNPVFIHHIDSRFPNGIYGNAPSGGVSATMSFGVANNLEMKIVNRDDTTGKQPYKVVSLIDNFSIDGGYNFAADSMNWSLFQVNLRLKFPKLNNYSVNLSTALDPYMYQLNAAGYPVRTNKQYWHNHRFPHWSGLRWSFNYTLSDNTIRKWRDKIEGRKTRHEENEDDEFAPLERNEDGTDKNAKQKKKSEEEVEDGYIRTSFPWSISVSYSLAYTAGSEFDYDKMYYKMVFTNNLSFGGSLGLGKGWKVSASMSYDFDHKQLTSCNLNVSRDLHCWNMSASINPIGPFKSYTFHLGVNASVLQDLKYDKNSNSSTNSRINWW